MKALLLSGVGRYADPWHPFAETSAALATLLREAGFDVEIPDDVDAALEGLNAAVPNQTDSVRPDLLVVNVGLPRDGNPAPKTPDAARGLRRWLDDGGPLLACHVSSTSFLDFPEWEEAVGGRWIRGTSMHPDYGLAEIQVDRDSAPLAAGIPDFTVMDERYSWLRTVPGITVHATHQHDRVSQPLIWSLTRLRPEGTEARSFYDGLGHDAASFESPEHRELLQRAIAWLVDIDAAPRT
ncbi:ThuA domain-containing protein [Arthrobacter sp. ISL-30]|uniref:ThuA domain-containing protein n=1 Tax=Arthrobacter sp. ISL-30 TaxID=2819109 RepID=UPI001BE68478|nr:ThuA domain-containing protein [Arthrobacter sp. ISL-30]MBT2512430.1 ThuA domain-containing protein [Arthrobacter sp. ISL-30]